MPIGKAVQCKTIKLADRRIQILERINECLYFDHLFSPIDQVARLDIMSLTRFTCFISDKYGIHQTNQLKKGALFSTLEAARCYILQLVEEILGGSPV